MNARSHFLVLVAVAFASLLAAPAAAFTPDSPEVKAMVEKGVKRLETAQPHQALGGDCLVALALLKAGAPKDHPVIGRALHRCETACNRNEQLNRFDIYSTGIAIILLSEYDPSRYRQKIEALVESLLRRQKEHGGFGYPLDNLQHGATGDTSMTQYAVLAMWSAERSGAVDIPDEAITAVAAWLLRTQDPSGGWGYQGNDPGVGNYQLIKQDRVRHSLTAAGLGSALICGDLLELATAKPQGNQGLPPCFRLVVEEADVVAQPKAIAKTVYSAAVARALGWVRNNYEIEPEPWTYYYMYALERAMSFHEMTQERVDEEPKWYNDGVLALQRRQGDDGAWSGQGGANVDTAFAVLFLCRSTRKSIEEQVYARRAGAVTGGRGLPADVSDVRLAGGKLVGQGVTAQADALLEQLENAGEDGFGLVEAEQPSWRLSDNAAARQTQLERFRKIVRNGPFESRLAAVALLAESGELDHAPPLIVAITDPDDRITLAARDGLRLISRRPDGMGLSDDPTLQAKAEAAKRWLDWYRGVRPTADVRGLLD